MAVAIAVSAIAFIIAGFLAKHTFNRFMAVVDRMPEASWFKEVKEACDRVPEAAWFERVEDKVNKVDPDRMLEHYARVHSLSNTTFANDLTLKRIEKQNDDHEGRIRVLEGKK